MVSTFLFPLDSCQDLALSCIMIWGFVYYLFIFIFDEILYKATGLSINHVDRFLDIFDSPHISICGPLSAYVKSSKITIKFSLHKNFYKFSCGMNMGEMGEV